MEIMQFAIGMEKDGEKYYREQAEKNKENALRIVFLGLASDENRHADLLQRMAEDLPYELESDNNLKDRDSLFKAVEDYQSSVKASPEQAEVYRTAMEMEQKSIDLYGDLQRKAEEPISSEVFTFLVKEETRHFNIMEGLFRFVNRPNDWVEAAEFGIREEY
ncbi:MAG: ferritin family protein [Eubacteriales bacterium]|nr:ferritin family protein [Eubacteriales bacterium]